MRYTSTEWKNLFKELAISLIVPPMLLIFVLIGVLGFFAEKKGKV